MHKEHLILLADPVYSWETEKAYIWQDDAACGFQPPTLFEIAREGDPIAEDLTPKELWDLNSTNLLAAKKICDGCPVLDQCLTSAHPEDFRYVMRAGIMPANFTPRGPGRPKGVKNRKVNSPDKPCKNGHELRHWKERSDTRNWECRQCIRERNGHREMEPLSPLCPQGHEDWAYRKSNGRRYCKTCNREANQARYHAKKAEEAAKVEG